MMDRQEIVITGLGVVSPIGIGVPAFWESLEAKKTGIRIVHENIALHGHPIIAANIPDFDGKDWVKPRKSIKVMSREIQIAYAAAMMACENANIEAGKLDPDRFGVVFGGEIIFSDFIEIEGAVRRCSESGEMDHSLWGSHAPAEIFPLWMLRSLPNMAACHVGIAVDARGPNNTITTEETSSLGALIEAAMVIDRKQADIMIVGSAASRTNPTRLLQRHEKFYSKCDSVNEACRPFDARRQGTVPGEGSAVLVIETRQHAEQRGAKILAKLSGWGSRFVKPESPLEASSKSVAGSIAQSLSQSGLTIGDLDFVNASANGSLALDRAEATGIASVGQVPVTSYKGYFGDMGCSSGMMELAACVLSLQNNVVLPTMFHESTASDCPIGVVSSNAVPLTKGNLAKISTTPHGHCVSVVLSR
jgi:3-oxoacyl-[acyl-carrier-protein] synthase II